MDNRMRCSCGHSLAAHHHLLGRPVACSRCSCVPDLERLAEAVHGGKHELGDYIERGAVAELENIGSDWME